MSGPILLVHFAASCWPREVFYHLFGKTQEFGFVYTAKSGMASGGKAATHPISTDCKLMKSEKGVSGRGHQEDNGLQTLDFLTTFFA